MARILILGASSDNIPLIEKCKSLGDYVIVVDYNPDSPGFSFADKKYLVSIIDNKEILNIAQTEKIDGILTISDLPTTTLAYICEKLDLPGPSLKVSELSKNKFLLREALRKNDFKTPEFFLIKEIHDLKKIKNLPVVIKPVDAVASRGVKKISSQEKLFEYYEYSKSFSKIDEVIVEEYISGKEYSVEALTQNGKINIIGITEKNIAKSETNSFVEERHLFPANISQEQKNNIEKYTISVLEKLGFNNTSTHTELKLTKNGEIHIIEIASRIGGDYINSDLIPLATGIDMFENIRNISIGKPINIKQTKNIVSTIQYFTSNNYSEALKMEKLATEEGILIKCEKKNFINIDLNNSLDRLGYFICASKNYSRLEMIFGDK